MGEVIHFTRKAWLEFEDEALRKLTLLAEMMLRVPDLLAVVCEEPEPGEERAAAHRFLELMSLLEEAIEELNAIAPMFVDMPQRWQAIFDLQCDLTNLRVKAFATARCSILYVHNFEVEGLDEVFRAMGEHRRRLLPRPRPPTNSEKDSEGGDGAPPGHRDFSDE